LNFRSTKFARFTEYYFVDQFFDEFLFHKSVVISEQLELDATDLRLLDCCSATPSHQQPGPGRAGACVAPTCLRRVKRLRDAGLIERDRHPERRQAGLLGHGLSAIVEITLDRQGAEHLEAFERAWRPTPPCSSATASRRGRTLCWWCLPDMPAYLALAQRLFTSDANVRNVKAFFSVIICYRSIASRPLPGIKCPWPAPAAHSGLSLHRPLTSWQC
jgi:Lrp/AsnC family leucine-responsive transcriptional regulator